MELAIHIEMEKDLSMQNNVYLILAAGFIILMSLIAFAAFGVDKGRARSRRWRIPEAALLLLAIFGGSPGAWIGMLFFHHKTRKPKFAVGIPVILVLQITGICAIYWFLCKSS